MASKTGKPYIGRLTLNPEGPDLGKDLQLQPAWKQRDHTAGMGLTGVTNEGRRPGGFLLNLHLR